MKLLTNCLCFCKSQIPKLKVYRGLNFELSIDLAEVKQQKRVNKAFELCHNITDATLK